MGWHKKSLPENISDIYYYMGMGLDRLHEDLETLLSIFFGTENICHFKLPNFTLLREFLIEDPLDNIHKHSKLSIFRSREEENQYQLYFQKINNEYINLLKIIEMKSNFSFNKIIDHWENIIAPSTSVDMNAELNLLRTISNKYYNKLEYSEVLDVFEEAKTTLLYDLFFSKKTTKQDVDQIKNFINKLLSLAEPRNSVNFFDTESFETDISIIQATLLSLVTKHPEIFNSCNLHDVMAIQFINDPLNIDKKVEEGIALAQHFPVRGPYYSVTIFVDYSILVQRTESANFELFFDFKFIPTLVNNAFTDYLKFMTRKTPTVSKYLLNGYQKLFEKYTTTLSSGEMFFYNFSHIVRNYAKYETVLKSNNFNILGIFKDFTNPERLLENISDSMYSVIRNHHIDKYSKAIFSNKYKHLYSDKLLIVFTELYRLDVPCSYIQDTIGKKMASFKRAEDLYDALENVLSLLDNFSFEIINEQAIKMQAEIISCSDNKLLVRIKNFEQSKALGSSSWCISRDEYYFSEYTKNNNEQYFLYDFNKISRDNECLIGCTLTSSLKLTFCHLKNDLRIEKDKNIDYIIKKVKEYKKDTNSSINFITKIRKIFYKSVKVAP